MKQWRDSKLRFSASNFLQDVFKNPALTPEDLRQAIREAVMREWEVDTQDEFNSKKRVKKANEEKHEGQISGVKIPDAVNGFADKTIADLADDWQEEPTHIGDWLHGKWLEDYVLAELLATSQDTHVHDPMLGLESEIWDAKSKDDKFVTELLGKGRAKLFLENKITLANLISKNGEPLTLKQLNAKYL